ncbi:MAG: alpha-ribazole phosphatase [Pseudomonadota bacterium]
MALILLRHTAPDIEPGICYGQTDVKVAQDFEADAAKVFESLPRVRQIVSSPLVRCRKLADYLASRLELESKEDAGLMEIDFGAWELQAWSDIPRAEIDAWAADFFNARPHGGESVAMLNARVRASLRNWSHSDEHTLIITHAGVIRAALSTGDTAEDFDRQIAFGDFVTLSPTLGTVI